MNALRPNRSTLLAIVVIALLAGLLRGWVVHSEMLWLDELHTSWTVGDSLSDVMPRAVDGNQQPLFFWLTWISTSLLGHSEFSLRLLPMLAGIGTLLTASWLTWRWSQSSIAMIVVAVLVAIDGQFIFYASEARPYALVQWLGIVQAMLFFGALESKTAKVGWNQNAPFWWLAAVSILIAYTHLTSVWLLGLEVIFFVIYFVWTQSLRKPDDESKRRDLRLSRFLATAVVTIAGLIPLFIQTQAIMQRKGNWESVSSIERLLRDSCPWLLVLIGLPIMFLVIAQVIQDERRNSDVVLVKPFVSEHFWRVLFVLFWAVAPVIVVAVLDNAEIAPLALLRYTIVGSAAFPVFAGLCIGCLSGPRSRIILAILIVGLSAMLSPLVQTFVIHHQLVQFRNEEWQRPVEQINSDESRKTYPVFLFANVIEDNDALVNLDARFQDYLLFPIGGMYAVNRQGRDIAAGPTLALTHFNEAHINRIKSQRGAWILIRADRNLVDEIQEELQLRIAGSASKDAGQIQFALSGTTDGPLYLLSVDY